MYKFNSTTVPLRDIFSVHQDDLAEQKCFKCVLISNKSSPDLFHIYIMCCTFIFEPLECSRVLMCLLQQVAVQKFKHEVQA